MPTFKQLIKFPRSSRWGKARTSNVEELIVDPGQEPPLTENNNVSIEKVEVPAHVCVEPPPAACSESSPSVTSTPPSMLRSDEGAQRIGEEGKAQPCATTDSVCMVEEGQEGPVGETAKDGEDGEDENDDDDEEEEDEEEEDEEEITNSETNAREAYEHDEGGVLRDEVGVKEDEGGGTRASATRLCMAAPLHSPPPLAMDTGGHVIGGGEIQDNEERPPSADTTSMLTDERVGVKPEGAMDPAAVASMDPSVGSSMVSEGMTLSTSTPSIGTARERRAVQRALARQLARLPDEASPTTSPDKTTSTSAVTQASGLKDDMHVALEQLRKDGVCITRLSRSLRSSARRLKTSQASTKRAEEAAARAHRRHAKLCTQIGALKALLPPLPQEEAEVETEGRQRRETVREEVGEVGGRPGSATTLASSEQPGSHGPSASGSGTSAVAGATPKVPDHTSAAASEDVKNIDGVKGPVAAAVARLESAISSATPIIPVPPRVGPSLLKKAGGPVGTIALQLAANSRPPSPKPSLQQRLGLDSDEAPRGSPSHHTHNQRMRPAAAAPKAPPAPLAKESKPIDPLEAAVEVSIIAPAATPAALAAPRVPPPAGKRSIKPLLPPAARHTGVQQAALAAHRRPSPTPSKAKAELCPQAQAHSFLSSRCRTTDLPAWAALVLSRLPQPPTGAHPLPRGTGPFVLPALLHINTFLPVPQQLTPTHVSLLALPPLPQPLPSSPLQALDLLLAHPTPIETRHKALVRLHPSMADDGAIKTQHDFLTDVAGRLVLRGAMHTWGPGYFRFHDPQAGSSYAVHFRDLTGLDGGVERVAACKDSSLRGLLRGRGACLDPVHELISLSRAVSVFPLPAGTRTLREAHRACFFKHVSKGRGRVSRLLVQMVRLLGILRANDVACCHLNPDNVLLVPGDSNERFTLMVKSLEHGVGRASKATSRRLGSWAMQPPETILGLPTSTAAAQDTWAGGMLVLWCALEEMTWTSDLVGLVDPWRRGRTTPATDDETAELTSAFSAAVGRMLRALARRKAGGRGLMNGEAQKALGDLLSLDPSARLEALSRHVKTVNAKSGGKTNKPKAATAAGEVRNPPAGKAAKGHKKGGKMGCLWRWCKGGKGSEELTGMHKEEIGKRLFESAPPLAETFAQYKARHRCVNENVGEGGHGCVSGYTARLPLLKRLFANQQPTLALKNMDDSSHSIRGKAQREVALHQAVAHLPSGTHLPHYAITGEHEAEYFMPFKRVMLDDLMSGGFFYQNSEEVNRVRWLRLLFLLCDALRAYRTLDIAHRDLKPNNIAVDFTETTFYITVLDWGEGCFRASMTPITPRIGTPGYQPVEVMAGLGGMVGSSHDITSVARIMVKAAVGSTTWTDHARGVMRDWGRLLDAHYENRLDRLEPWLRDLRPDRLSCALQTEASRFVSDVAERGMATPAALPLLRALLSPLPEVKEQLFCMDFEAIFGALAH